MDHRARRNRLKVLYTTLRQAMRESFRIREAAEDLQRAAAEIVAVTVPERRQMPRPRPLKADLKARSAKHRAAS